jgi:hypothetical protein
MPEPPNQSDMRSQDLPPRRPHVPTGFVQGSPAVLLVNSVDQIPAALAQGKPVLIDLPAFQWRASLLATIQKWSGSLGWWLFDFLVKLLLTQWLLAQGFSAPDWAKFNFVRQPDNKVILSPHEE